MADPVLAARAVLLRCREAEVQAMTEVADLEAALYEAREKLRDARIDVGFAFASYKDARRRRFRQLHGPVRSTATTTTTAAATAKPPARKPRAVRKKRSTRK